MTVAPAKNNSPTAIATATLGSEASQVHALEPPFGACLYHQRDIGRVFDVCFDRVGRDDQGHLVAGAQHQHDALRQTGDALGMCRCHHSAKTMIGRDAQED